MMSVIEAPAATVPVARVPLLDRFRPGTLGGKVVRCLAVSAASTVLTSSILAGLTLRGVAPVQANLAGTAAGTALSYVLNRRWVWQLRGKSDFRRQVVPFWLLSFAGLVLSTIAVAAAGHWATALALHPVVRSATLVAANMAAYGLLWIGQFVVLDRVLFKPQPAD